MTAQEARELAKLNHLFDCEVKAIDAALGAGNRSALKALVLEYYGYAINRRTRNRAVWATLFEMATAAWEISLHGLEVTCGDCGDTFAQTNPANYGDTDHTCPECGDSRQFAHATGRYYDAFA